MEKAGTIRVAMVRGPGGPERDGVSDYVAHLREALAGVRVEAVDVPGDSAGGRSWAAVAAAHRRVYERVLEPRGV
jgi:hypothetical protein